MGLTSPYTDPSSPSKADVGSDAASARSVPVVSTRPYMRARPPAALALVRHTPARLPPRHNHSSQVRLATGGGRDERVEPVSGGEKRGCRRPTCLEAGADRHEREERINIMV